MSTTTRVGIDIVGQDKTRAAFASATAGLAGFNRSLNQIKGAMAGLAGGNLLAGFVRSMVGINREVPSVKAAIDKLTGAWTLFGQKVGDAGLNQALINFATRMGGLVTGTDGLSRSIGAFLGGAVNTMAAVFEGIGRSIAFVYDNMAAFGRLLSFVGIAVFARNVINAAIAFQAFAKVIRSTGIIMTVFSSISRANLYVFMLLATGVAYATDTLDSLKSGIDLVWQKAKEVFPQIGGIAKDVFKGLGLNIDAFDDGLIGIRKNMNALKDVMAPTTEATAKLDKATGGLKKTASGVPVVMKDLTAAVEPVAGVFEGVAGTIKDAFGDALRSVVTRTASIKEALSSLTTSLLSTFGNKLMDAGLNGLFNSGSSWISQATHPLYGSLPSFAVGTPYVPRDMVAKIHQGEAIIPAREATALRAGAAERPVVFQVINQAGAQVEQRETQGPNGERMLQAIIRKEVMKTNRAAFGLRPQNTRR